MNIKRLILCLVVVAAAGLAAGCTKDKFPMGGLGGSCFADGTCNPGLTCLSSICVRYTDSGTPTKDWMVDYPPFKYDTTKPPVDAAGDAAGDAKVAPDSLVDAPPSDLSAPPGTWVTIAAGSFSMGSPKGEACRVETIGAPQETPHKVILSNSFQIMDREVNQQHFQSVMGYNPSATTGCNACPVESVNWHQATAYANALSTLAGLTPCYTCTGSGTAVQCQVAAAYGAAKFYSCPGYRLPTEAEWEYAYRAGTQTSTYAGAITVCEGVDAVADAIGWYIKNSASSPQPGGKKQANAWKLYDMPGNVMEWVNDGYLADLGSLTVTDPTGAPYSPSRVLRGGAHYTNAVYLRAAARDLRSPNYLDNAHGFRIVRTLFGAVPDAGTTTPDSAVTGPDAGATTPDAAATGPDAGATTPDATATGPDAGTATPDSGAGTPAWKAMPSPTTQDLYGVWGTGPSNVYAVGAGATVLQYNGKAWSAVMLPSALSGAVTTVWASGPSDVWIGGGSGVLRNNGTGWTIMPAPASADNIWGNSASNIYFVSGLAAYRYTGTGVTTYNILSPGNNSMVDLWGVGPTDVFAVSKAGSSGGSCWASLRRFNGSSWASSTSPSICPSAIWGTGPSNILIVGAKTSTSSGYSAAVATFNGTSWSAMSLPTGGLGLLSDVWGSEASDVYTVGQGGVILHHDGGSWKQAYSGTTNYLSSVWGSGPSDVFAVGQGGTILHYSTP